MVSVVIPVLNEALLIGECLDGLASLVPHHEVIVVDGGSTDGTVEEIEKRPWAMHVRSRAGRGAQMNAGAVVARQQTLLFLHCDLRLPPDALDQVEQGMASRDVAGGGFLKAYRESHRLPDSAGAAIVLLALEWTLNHVRTRLMGDLVGSNAMFVRSSVFAQLGGFRDWPLLEDVDMSDRLKRQGRIVVLDGPVEVSPRKYLRDGTLTRLLVNARVMFGYRVLGESPATLASIYRRATRPLLASFQDSCGSEELARVREPSTAQQGAVAVSVIVPTLDEEAALGRCLRLAAGHAHVEVIVADGGSTDGTRAVAEAHPGVTFLRCPERGRAMQMNAGARAASGSILVFLHADTELPAGAFERIREALRPRSGLPPAAGAFDIELAAVGWKYRLIEWLSNRRNRWLQTPYGDQCLFLKREVFEAAGGFPRQPFLEDLAMARVLGRLGPIDFLSAPCVRTSARRFEVHGPLKTAARNTVIAALYNFGVPAGWLRAGYLDSRVRLPLAGDQEVD